MSSPRQQIRIATWNCFGAPPTAEDFFAGRCFWPERLEAPAVVAALAACDLVCVQENLVPRVREGLEHLQRAAGFAELWFDPMGPDPGDNTFVGGGLAVLSRFPLEARFARLPRGAGPDGFARKGFAIATVTLPGGARLQVINTHLQADDPLVPLESCQAARAAQIEDLLAALAAAQGGGVTTILCGDLNVIHGSDEYAALHRRLGGAFVDLAARAGLTTYDVERNDVTRAFHPGGPGSVLLDYIWVPPDRVVARDVRMILDAPLDEPLGRPTSYAAAPFSSDHFAVAATLEILA